jgi:hypothetical protein
MAAFQECISLTSITISDNVITIENQAFVKCSKLASVTFEGNIDSENFSPDNSFPGDLRTKYLTAGVGTYTKKSGKWTKS